MVSIPNLLVICITSFYVVYTCDILFFGQKKKIIEKNLKLHELRKKPVKTVKEQKEFLLIKNPKVPFNLFAFIRRALIFIGLSLLLRFVFIYFTINLQMWMAIFFVILFPLLYNIVLKKFNLEKDDLFYLIK
jgi:magnesium-transporting ATPase (P-type)